jgi:endo-1,4-beta-xylanase
LVDGTKAYARCLGAARTFLAGLILLGVLANSARAVPLRGLEARMLRGSAPAEAIVADSSASGDQALLLNARGSASAEVQTIAARVVQITAKSECGRPAFLSLRIDQRPSRTLEVGANGWDSRNVAMVLDSGEHSVRLKVLARVIGQPMPCDSVTLDRIDFLPRSPSQAVVLGAAVRTLNLFADKVYRNTWLRDFDSMTPENELKILLVEPELGQFNFSKPDAMVALAVRNHKQIRGHTLVFGYQIPTWLSDPKPAWTRDSLLAVMHKYIRTVMIRYAGRVNTWDVVDEAFNDDGTYRQNIWYDVIGPGYIEDAFRYAREADPKARLFYNDYGAEGDGPKQRAILAMLRDFKVRHVPIDGMGIENHVWAGEHINEASLQDTFELFAQLGFDVEVTEMDVPTVWAGLSNAGEVALQAQLYRDAATACWDVAACKGVTTWGVGDAVSWLGSTNAPLMFNTHYRPKPAFMAVETALHHAIGVGAPTR